MTILLTGGDTTLSREFKKIFNDILIPDSQELDLTNKKILKSFFLYMILTV